MAGNLKVSNGCEQPELKDTDLSKQEFRPRISDHLIF